VGCRSGKGAKQPAGTLQNTYACARDGDRPLVQDGRAGDGDGLREFAISSPGAPPAPGHLFQTPSSLILPPPLHGGRLLVGSQAAGLGAKPLVGTVTDTSASRTAYAASGFERPRNLAEPPRRLFRPSFGDLFDHLGYEPPMCCAASATEGMPPASADRSCYSNIGFFLAGELAAAAGGQAFTDLRTQLDLPTACHDTEASPPAPDRYPPERRPNKMSSLTGYVRFPALV